MNQDQSGSCLSLKISLVASEEGFYQQSDGSMIKLGTTRLTITRVTLRNKKDMVIVVRIHKNVVISAVFNFMTIIFRISMELRDT